MKKLLLSLGLISLFISSTSAQSVTALWDFKNNLPEGIRSTSIQTTTGTVASTVDGISMYVNATSGKLAGRDSDAQFTAGTILQVPVKSTNDVLTVVSHPNYHNYTIGGTAATADTEEHKATTAEVAAGYVVIEATKESYLYSVQVLQAGAVQEKKLYSTDFTDWTTEIDRKTATNETYSVKTKYSKEDLTFTFNGVGVYPTGSNSSKFSYVGYMMTAKYEKEYSAAEPSAVTSPLSSISKIVFTQCATGGTRGYKVSVKGDGDEDWVALHNVSIVNSKGETISLDVNRTNCQLKFENFKLSENAYMADLAIYGEVDMSQSPVLGSFSLNGVKYEAADIFEEGNSGNQLATILVSKKAELITESNPLTDIVADNGTIKSTTYTTTGEGYDRKTVVSMVVENNGDEITYELTVAFKPDYTLSYYDADGVTLLGTQLVEQDAEISEFAYTSANVNVASGKAFRGWSVALVSGKRKYSTSDVITADATLYALVTDIETANQTSRYEFDLNNQYFYSEDHEAFVVNDESVCKFHDTTHGWTIGASGKITLLLGGKGYVKLGLCQYSSEGTISLVSPTGTTVATVDAKASKDGAPAILMNDSEESGAYTLEFTAGAYLHNVAIVNMTDSPYDQIGSIYVVKAGDVDALFSTLEIVNAKNSASDAEPSYIFLPDGTYDMGETVLTAISGNNISIVGQSMDNTIIVNSPLVENEGIGTTATFYITGTNTYFQDLTIQNALDYYSSGSAGRAVCIQDKGTKTICKNVKMLSYQDTYYSNNGSGKFYWEDSEIHGTVDYICGGGDAYFNRCLLVNESRSKDSKSGDDVIAAPYTDGSEWGYVFNNCTVENLAAGFSWARAWGGKARTAFINTTLNQPNEISSTRYQLAGMNVAADKFVEYKTLDADGNVVSPTSNICKFTLTKDNVIVQENEMETILTADEAAAYALDKVFTDWAPASDAKQADIAVSLVDGVLNFTSEASYFAIFKNGEFVEIVTDKTYDLNGEDADDYTVRAANGRGGFGKAVKAGEDTAAVQDIDAADAEVVSTTIYSLSGARLASLQRGINIVVRTLSNGATQAARVIVK